MNTNKVFLLLNGEAPIKLPDLSQYELICATDGAYQLLADNNITPNFISGDFDSINTIPEHIQVIHTPNQDFTDFDKVLQIISERGFTDVDVFGASGKEQDHFLGNLHTALQWKGKINLTFYDNHGHYFLAKKETQLSNIKGRIVSLVPFPTASQINTSGLLYPLNSENLTFGKRIGTRNTANKDQVSISFSEGELFIFIGH